MRKRLIGIGLAIILLTNVMVLGNVFYNRSGLPESQLTLSEREFSQPWRGQSKEDSGMELALNWRVLPPPAEKPHYNRYVMRGSAAWLDQQKMQALGFTLPNNAMHRPITEKEVIFVLELNGAAYQQSLNEAQAHLAEARADAAKSVIDKQDDAHSSPADPKKETPLASAQHELDEEAQKASRLFVIDAGLDATVLRARYPDRQRYALMRGLVQQLIQHDENKKMAIFGSISQIFTAEIHIPHEFESAAKAPHFTAQVAFGKKLEPWVVEVKGTP